MNEDLKALYQKVILEHNKNPKHFYEIEAADHSFDAYNPVCGDRFKIYIKMENDKISEVSFKGYGCAISKASCSIMVENLKGKTLAEAKAIHQEFSEVIATTNNQAEDSVFQVFAAARSFPGRMDCVTLGWEEVKRFLEGKTP